MFARNVWYVAAWSSEVTTEKPFGRRILNEPVAFYRKTDGRAAALFDRCCHRGYPLTHGRIIGSNLQCGYHGIEFNCEGACIRIPGQETIPSRAKVRSFPVEEKDGLIWIWMGDAERARQMPVPGYQWHTDERWGWKGTTFLIKSNHLYLSDNLLDASHLGYVHLKTVGGNPGIHDKTAMKVERTDRSVTVSRLLPDTPPAPTYTKMANITSNIDRWQDIHFQPGLICVDVGATKVGTGQTAEGRANAMFEFRVANGVTPETEHTTHYFWSAAQSLNPSDAAVTNAMYDEIEKTFREDWEVIEAQYERLLEAPDWRTVDVNNDVASVQARRIYDSLIREEYEVGTVSPS
jgi:phenylpropionate dioxygenase-like ring-hydroxylating dioxygenase large terminal subunit